MVKGLRCREVIHSSKNCTRPKPGTNPGKIILAEDDKMAAYGSIAEELLNKINKYPYTTLPLHLPCEYVIETVFLKRNSAYSKTAKGPCMCLSLKK